MAADTQGTNWQAESLYYDMRHPRLVQMSKLIASLPHRSILDIGCAVGTMRQLLPADVDYYGCDITDHAGKNLEPGHFQQLDLNVTHDFSFFANRGIRTVNMSGVLEYVNDPADLLQVLNRLVGPGGNLVLSMTNFQAERYAASNSHHAAWLFKPQLEALRALLVQQNWRITRERGCVGKMGWRTPLYRFQLGRRGVDHPWTRKVAWYFLIAAEAVAPGL